MTCRLSQTYQLSRIQLTKTKLRLSISALQLAPWYGSVILLLNDNYANLMLDHWRRSKEFMDIKRFGNKIKYYEKENIKLAEFRYSNINLIFLGIKEYSVYIT